MNGIPPLGKVSGIGAYYPAHYQIIVNAAGASTINDLMYIPYYFDAIDTFTGMGIRNTGTGDSGDKIRLGAYTAHPTTYKPDNLIIDCGEVTISGAAANNLAAASWTTPYIGWGYLAVHFKDATTFQYMTTAFCLTGAGVVVANPTFGCIGLFSLQSTYGGGNQIGSGSYLVTTAYGALAATAVAPTSILTISAAAAPYIT